MSNYYYLDISLEFPNQLETEIIPAILKKNIVEAVKQLFGEVAAAVNIDLLKYNSNNTRVIIRVPKSHYVKLRSSLTLASKYEGEICTYRIHKTSSLLLTLQGDSRNYNH